MKRRIHLFLIFLLFLLQSNNLFSQNNQIPKGTVQRIRVHGNGLENNLSGDSADRYVSIYLPANYKANPKKRYPVVYFLHGNTDDDAKFYGISRHNLAK